MFLRRLESYTEVPPTVGTMDIIVQKMVDSILRAVMKEIKQGRMGKYSLYKYDNVH